MSELDYTFDRTIGLGDLHGHRVEISVSAADDGGPAMIHFNVRIGMSGVSASVTNEAARQLAAALLDAVDAAEGSS